MNSENCIHSFPNYIAFFLWFYNINFPTSERSSLTGVFWVAFNISVHMEFHKIAKSIIEYGKLRFLQGHLSNKKTNLNAAETFT